MQTCYLAVDIGASSGRHIIGTVEHGVMALHEVYRFENRLIERTITFAGIWKAWFRM